MACAHVDMGSHTRGRSFIPFETEIFVPVLFGVLCHGAYVTAGRVGQTTLTRTGTAARVSGAGSWGCASRRTPWPFFGVLGAEHRAAVFLFVRERFGFGHAFGVVQRLQDRFDGQRPVAGDDLGDLARLGQRLPVGHHVADEADLFRFGGGEMASGQQDVGSDRVRHLTRRVARPSRPSDTATTAPRTHRSAHSHHRCGCRCPAGSRCRRRWRRPRPRRSPAWSDAPSSTTRGR